MIPKGCALDKCGFTPNGLRVRAITDAMGAQVVVTNDSEPDNDSLLSEPLGDHSTAIELGKKNSGTRYLRIRGMERTNFYTV